MLLLLTKEPEIVGVSDTKLVRLDIVLFIVSELVPKVKVPTIVSAARALKLLVVRNVGIHNKSTT